MRIRVVIRWSPIGVKDGIRYGVERLYCLVGGHTEQIVRRDGTMALHCARCGHTSPGWQLDAGTTARRA